MIPAPSAVHPQPQDGRTSRRLHSSSGLSPGDVPLPIEVAVAIVVVVGLVGLGHLLSLLHRELFERLLLLLRWRQVRVRVVDILRVGRDLPGERKGLDIERQQEIGGGGRVGRSCEGKDERTRARATTHLWNSPLLPDGRVLLQQGLELLRVELVASPLGRTRAGGRTSDGVRQVGRGRCGRGCCCFSSCDCSRRGWGDVTWRNGDVLDVVRSVACPVSGGDALVLRAEGEGGSAGDLPHCCAWRWRRRRIERAECQRTDSEERGQGRGRSVDAVCPARGHLEESAGAKGKQRASGRRERGQGRGESPNEKPRLSTGTPTGSFGVASRSSPSP